jgi:hypothetical protein
MARKKTALIHIKNNEEFDVNQDKLTLKYYIRNTDIEVSGNKLKRKTNKRLKKSDYNFDKPFQAQELGDEWDDYCWGANDF